MININIGKFKIKEVKVANDRTLIELLEPIAVEINSKTETISKISIKSGTINKEGVEYKEGREINFQNPIAVGRIKLSTLLDQTKKMVINNENDTINLEVRETDEEKVIG